MPGGGAAGAAGGGVPVPPATTRIDAPDEYSFLTIGSITDMCEAFEEVIKGQSNRELLSDFNSLIDSAPTLTLGAEVGGAIKPKNATDAQRTRALEVIVQGMILEKKLEGTRQEERMEALMEPDKFNGLVSCMSKLEGGVQQRASGGLPNLISPETTARLSEVLKTA